MPFNIEGWNQVSSGKNTAAPATYSYKTPDSISDILPPNNYFGPKAQGLKANDLIEVISSSDSNQVYTGFKVDSVTGNNVAITPIAFSEIDSSFVVAYQQISANELSAGVGTVTTISPGSEIPQGAQLQPLFFLINYSLLAPGSLTLNLGHDGFNYLTNVSTSPVNRNVIDVSSMPPLASPTSYLNTEIAAISGFLLAVSGYWVLGIN